ncbi:MAG TPA: hypothetical protein DCQ98_15650 [Planctomycetaceae bacterium]|nr:hypothetical protein [Planctomycetaceae bacterium]
MVGLRTRACAKAAAGRSASGLSGGMHRRSASRLVVLGASLIGASLLLPTVAAAQGDFRSWLPDEHLFGAVWAGRPSDDPSITAAERRVLDDEAFRFYGTILSAIPIDLDLPKPERVAEMWQGEGGARALLETRVAFYMRPVEIDMRSRPAAGIAIERGKFAEAFEMALRENLQDANRLERFRLGEHKVSRLAEANGDKAIEFGWIGEVFCLTYGGRDELAWWLERRDGDAWKALAERTRVDRPWGTVSLDAAGAVTLLNEQGMPGDLERMLRLTGLDRAGRAMWQVGFDDQGYRSRMFIESQGAPAGLLGLFRPGTEPIEFPPIAADSLLTVTTGSDLFAGLSSLAAELPAGSASAERNRNELVETLERYGRAFGPGLSFRYAPNDGGWFGGASVVMPIRDPAQAREQLERIEADLIEGIDPNAPFWNRMRFARSSYHDHPVSRFTMSTSAPFELAWVSTDAGLLLGLEPTGLKPVLDRIDGRRQDIARAPLGDDEGLRMQLDLRQLLTTPAGVLRFALLAIMVDSRRGFGDPEYFERLLAAATSLPDGAWIERIISEDSLSITTLDDGLAIDGRFSLPGSEVALVGGSLMMVGIAIDELDLDPLSLLVPAGMQRTQAMNNLKQIGLAMHNYHDTFNRFPDAATKDARGKSLLSWRVQLLPYLDQAALYDRFRHDEPWDSEHNLALLEQMPDVFRAPGVDLEPGMTPYVVIRQQGALYDEDGVGVRLAAITDGTSNTIMAVEANGISVVPWTRPDDLVPDMELLSQLAGLRGDGFLVVMADGAVRWIDAGTDMSMIEAMITRAGGEVVNFP